jgi:hypothetical protein
LLVGADPDQRRPDDTEADVVEDARRVDPGELLGIDHLLARTGAATAMLARPLRGEPAALIEAALPGAIEFVTGPSAADVAPSFQPAVRQVVLEPGAQLEAEGRILRRIGERDHVGVRLTVVSPAVRVGQHDRECGGAEVTYAPPHLSTLRQKRIDERGRA